MLAILVFGPLATGAVRTLEFLVLQGLTLGVLLLWGARFWLNPRPKIFWPPICWAVVAFVVYAIARYSAADIEYTARLELIRVLVYAVVFFAVLNNLHRQESVQIITVTLLFLAMCIAGYAVYQFVTGSDKVWHFIKPYPNRGSGTYISPNHMAGFLEMLLPLGLAYTLVGRQKPVMKVFLGYASLMIVAGIGVSVSRGSWLATTAVVCLFVGLLVFHRSYRWQAVALFLLLVVASTYFISNTYFLQKRIKHTLTNTANLESDTRVELWDASMRMWKDHFWWGVGPGHFDTRFRMYRPDAVQLRPDRAHNEYLNALADWGLVGTVIVLVSLVLLCAGVFKTWRYVRRSEAGFGQQTSNKYAFVLGASLGLLALALHSFVDFNMQIPANAILAVALIALLTSHLRFATERYWVSLGFAGRVGVTMVLLAALGYLGSQEARRAREYVWLERAAAEANFSKKQIVALERAFAAEPRNFDTTHAIGEAYRVQSWQGDDDYAELAEKAMTWFAKGFELNPHDGYNYLRYGMCLDWIGRLDESGPYFEKAELLDPNGYFTLANIGWHYVQLGQYAAARIWLERSRGLRWHDNPIAISYLEIVNQKLLENAAPK